MFQLRSTHCNHSEPDYNSSRMKVLVTGGAGFIGSCFVRLALRTGSFEIANLDKLTYAGNLENLAPIAEDPHYRFIKGDICDSTLVHQTFEEFQPQAVVH